MHSRLCWVIELAIDQKKTDLTSIILRGFSREWFINILRSKLPMSGFHIGRDLPPKEREKIEQDAFPPPKNGKGLITQKILNHHASVSVSIFNDIYYKRT